MRTGFHSPVESGSFYAVVSKKTWNIPENAEKPERSNKKKEHPLTLLDILQEQKVSKYQGGIYHNDYSGAL